ncbi:AMP-binding protein [Streptomyces tricolor]|nr:AMP-binding protein [Streptomyces tricolor]
MQSNAARAAGVTREKAGEGLHDVFAAHARARPSDTALIARDARVSYGALDARAEELAGRLAAAGVAPGHLVPILLPRSADLVAALLAVLRLGAAYALLDPDWPAARLHTVVEQLRPPLVVARPGTAADLPAPLWTPPAGDGTGRSPPAPRCRYGAPTRRACSSPRAPRDGPRR